jgi:FkbM family methyltransferase
VSESWLDDLPPNIDRATLTAALLSSIFMVREWWLHPYVPEKGRVFIDVGANIGSWTKWLSPRFEYVHAIDPNPSVIWELRHNLPLNVTVHEFAAWSSECVREFSRYECPDHFSGYFDRPFLGTTSAVLGKVSVPCQRLDVMSISGAVDFVKIDTEGGEVESVKGATSLLAHWRPRMMIEIHADANWIALEPILRDLGYSVLIIRHPLIAAGSEVGKEHFWLDCQPTAK